MNCMAYAFSNALGISIDRFIELIGHDGKQQCFEDKTFTRGFHIQECIDVCNRLGFACTEIQAFFGSSPYFGSKEVVEIYPECVCSARFLRYLETTTKGILAGFVFRASGKQVGHAVMWNGHRIIDSRGYDYRFEESEAYNFYPQTLWRLTKMELQDV